MGLKADTRTHTHTHVLHVRTDHAQCTFGTKLFIVESLCRQTFQINSNDFHIFVCVCTWIILFSKMEGKKWRIFTFHIWNHKNKANIIARHTMLFFINSSGILSNYTKLQIVQFLFNISYLEFSLVVLYNSLTIAWAEKCVRNMHSMIWWGILHMFHSNAFRILIGKQFGCALFFSAYNGFHWWIFAVNFWDSFSKCTKKQKQ